MTCQSALELLLDAEPSALSASLPTPLGVHLRGCVRCRRVAAQLMDDTQRLAVAMSSTVVVRRSANRVRQFALGPALAMAAIVLMVFVRGRSVEPDAGAAVIAPVTSVAPPAVVTPVAPALRAATPVSMPRKVVRHEGKAFAAAVPVAPVRLLPAQPAVGARSMELSGVTVTPPAGTRATVMHTANPKLVVVWLY